jgi:hypothetical protein
MRVTGDLDEIVDCNCSICTKKGFLHLIVPRERFELLAGRDDLTTYRFNTGVAQHTFCSQCGIYAFYVPRSDPDKVDVNVSGRSRPSRSTDGTGSRRSKIARAARPAEPGQVPTGANATTL